MYLSKKTKIKLTDLQSAYVGHMCYVAYKLWNVCNYERRSYTPDRGSPRPDWYTQKHDHKDDWWFKSLPSEVARNVLKNLDGAWRSYETMRWKRPQRNPQPPRYKHKAMPITYSSCTISQDHDLIRLYVAPNMRMFMNTVYRLYAKHLYFKNKIFEMADHIVSVTLYPPVHNVMDIIMVYEVPDVSASCDNSHYLSIDIGTHNLMTCYDNSGNGNSFIVGREYLSISRKYDKEIGRIQSVSYRQQTVAGIEYPTPSQHVLRLYDKKNNCLHDYLHKSVATVVEYCQEHDIHTVVIGDLTGLHKKKKRRRKKTNQKLYAMPYHKLTQMLRYKLELAGINVAMQQEPYSSQCSPISPNVSERYACGSNRVSRGLYIGRNKKCWNADAVGAYNILRLYFGKKNVGSIQSLSRPYVLHVAV